jgi:uncharacterized protein (TIGR02246 family)
MAFTGPAEDRQLIRELIGAYSDAAFRSDLEAYLACWTDDGVRTQAGQPELRGKAALREMWTQIWDMIERMAFFAEIGAIEVDGDRARTRVYCREIVFLKGGGVWKLVGIYTDQLVRQDGAWRFARRDYELFMDEGTMAKGELRPA